VAGYNWQKFRLELAPDHPARIYPAMLLRRKDWSKGRRQESAELIRLAELNFKSPETLFL